MSQDQHARSHDMRRLRSAFYGEFDRSHVERVVAEGEGSNFLGECLGSGAHFSTYILLPAGATQPLVLKLASSQFEQLKAARRESWIAALDEISKIPILVPPFEVILAEERIALVMPKGTRPLSDASTHWGDPRTIPSVLESRLESAGLAVEDSLQFVCWEGIPFLCDLSDVRLRAPASRPLL